MVAICQAMLHAGTRKSADGSFLIIGCIIIPNFIQ
jgi:hypothetical protein